MKKVLMICLVALFLAPALTSCREKSTAEKAGDAVEDVVDDVEDAVD